MKLRFYLRGLGMGIIFTALICGLGKSRVQSPMSDSEIIARAKELGMVEGTVLSQQGEINTEYTASLNEAGELVLETSEASPETETLETPENESIESDESIGTETDETVLPETEADSSAEESPATDETDSSVSSDSHNRETEESEETMQEETKQEETTQEETEQDTVTESGETIQITVKSGSGSYTVAQSCENAGLVTDARDFDNYLCANGYANRISVGTFDIPMDSSYETIAKIITRTK